MDALLAVDLGATNLRAALARADAVRTASGGDAPARPDLLARVERPTPQGPTGEGVADALGTVAQEACGAAGVDTQDVVSAGVGSIGPVDAAAGAVVDPPNVPVDRVPVVESLAATLDLPASRVAFRNDCVAGVLGERAFGGAPANAVYLTISTGIGAGACVDGTVLSGHRGNAAEMGHVVVDPAGRLDCGCGAAGHWEAYCSGTGVPRLAASLAATEGVETSLTLGGSDGRSLDAATVFAAADGDPLAARTLEEVARLNAIGLAATVHAFAPETVRVGGAVARSNPEAVLAPLRERLPDHLAVEAPAVEAASFGGDAVLFGALAAAREVA
jgi:glucokinase